MCIRDSLTRLAYTLTTNNAGNSLGAALTSPHHNCLHFIAYSTLRRAYDTVTHNTASGIVFPSIKLYLSAHCFIYDPARAPQLFLSGSVSDALLVNHRAAAADPLLMYQLKSNVVTNSAPFPILNIYGSAPDRGHTYANNTRLLIKDGNNRQ